MSLRNGNSTLPTKFMASIDSYDDASIVMAGVPMDFTCSFRPGTRFGPQKIREVSIGIEEYSVYMDRDLTQCSFFDAGDLDLPFGDVDKSLKLIGDVAEEILSDNKFPLFIGGEHLISVPVIKKVYEKYGPELIVVQEINYTLSIHNEDFSFILTLKLTFLIMTQFFQTNLNHNAFLSFLLRRKPLATSFAANTGETFSWGKEHRI